MRSDLSLVTLRDLQLLNLIVDPKTDLLIRILNRPEKPLPYGRPALQIRYGIGQIPDYTLNESSMMTIREVQWQTEQGGDQRRLIEQLHKRLLTQRRLDGLDDERGDRLKIPGRPGGRSSTADILADHQ